MDDLIKDLIEKAGLTEAQARAALEVFLGYIKHDEENRKKVIQAAIATTTASLVAARVI